MQHDQEPAAEAVWHENTPLTPGQQMHVDNLLSIETDNLAREVLITLKREGLPPNGQWREFLAQYALTGWDAASDAIAWVTLAKIAESDWDQLVAHAGQDMRPDDSEQHFVEIHISGTLNVYIDETFILGEDAPKMRYEVGDTARLFIGVWIFSVECQPVPQDAY